LIMRTFRCFTSFALLLFAAAPAFAQTPRESRPYRGLFGSSKGGSTDQRLTVSFNVGGGYDDDVLAAENAGGTLPADSPSSTIGDLSGSLSYGLSRSRATFFAQLSGGGSYYAALSNPWVTSQSAATGGAFELSSKTSFSMTAAVTRQSMYYLTALPSVPDPLGPPPIDPEAIVSDPFAPEPAPVLPISTDPVLGTRDSAYTTFGVNGGLGHTFNRRIAGSLHFQYEDSQQPSLEDFKRQTAGGGLSIGLTKGLSARLGYSIAQADWGGEDGQDRLHQIDAGIDFNHALSLTRRTTLAFRTGTAMLKDEIRTHVHVTGNAQLTRELGRTWTANAVYNREVSFLEVFREPVFSDSVSGGFGGLFNRHVQFQANIGTSFGSVGFTGVDNAFTNYFTSASLRFGFTRNLGLSLTYSFYHYRFEDGVDLPAGYRPETDRHSVRLSLNFWSTLFERRRSNASR